MPASREVFGSMVDKSGDTAVDLAVKLGLSSTKQVLDTFLQLVKREAVSLYRGRAIYQLAETKT